SSNGIGYIRQQEDEREFLEGTSLDTLAVCAKPKLKGPGLGTPIVPSISVSAIHRYKTIDDFVRSLSDGYAYPRLGNHSCESAAHAINSLEDGVGAMMFSSGMSGISATMLALLKSGDHVIAPGLVYAGSYSFMKSFLTKFDIEVTFVEAGNLDAYRKAIKPNTKILYGETPSNPSLGVLDLAGLATVTKEAPSGALSIVDSTFATPYLQQPLKLGIDVVIHSCSKYLGGHSDLVAGVACCKDLGTLHLISGASKKLGSGLSPFDGFLVLRGIRSLPVRMERHCKNAMTIAQFLEQHPKISRVSYPGLSSHPQHEVAKKQMRGYGGVVTFEMASGEAAKTVVESVKLINLAPSLGAPESLIEHPATMTRGNWTGMTDKYRIDKQISPGMIRFSVGLEDADDLIKDLTQALDKA
ncbi:L-methionine gamma-lyase-like, partial [Amphiura filiformis]|uniref:L-methionine gamma-lyase-like n=1 Tax=Amphiura filiformis TaxID=82378 RepID=UPI003B226743